MSYKGSPNSYFKQLPNLDYPSLANDRNSAYDYQVVKNIFKRAVLIKLTSKVTSRVRFEINFPVCTPSMNFVSVEINDFIISF